MKIVKLPKENLEEFIARLGAFGEIHAPTKRGDGSFAFAPVTGNDENGPLDIAFVEGAVVQLEDERMLRKLRERAKLLIAKFLRGEP